MADNSHIIGIYSAYIQTITANENRRQALSAFYLSIIAAGVALLASKSDVHYIVIAIPAAVVSLVWYFTLKYFRSLAKAKFKVIESLESQLEFKPFSTEWEHYNNDGDGLKFGLTQLEVIIPISIFTLNILYIFYWLFIAQA